MIAEFLEIERRLKDLERKEGRQFEVGRLISSRIMDGRHEGRFSVGTDDNGNDTPGPWVPIAEIAGAVRTFNRLEDGQVVLVARPHGDSEQAVIIPGGGWRGDRNSPADGDSQAVSVWQHGKVRVRVRDDDTVDVDVDGSKIQIKADRLRVRHRDGPRLTVTDTLAKLVVGGTHLVVTDGAIIASTPITIGADPVPDPEPE